MVGWAYIHGTNGISAPERQVRGSAVNQVEGVENVLITAGMGVLTSAFALSRA